VCLSRHMSKSMQTGKLFTFGGGKNLGRRGPMSITNERNGKGARKGFSWPSSPKKKKKGRGKGREREHDRKWRWVQGDKNSPGGRREHWDIERRKKV